MPGQRRSRRFLLSFRSARELFIQVVHPPRDNRLSPFGEVPKRKFFACVTPLP